MIGMELNFICPVGVAKQGRSQVYLHFPAFFSKVCVSIWLIEFGYYLGKYSSLAP